MHLCAVSSILSQKRYFFGIFENKKACKGDNRAGYPEKWRKQKNKNPRNDLKTT